jgi:hypothetical protein
MFDFSSFMFYMDSLTDINYTGDGGSGGGSADSGSDTSASSDATNEGAASSGDDTSNGNSAPGFLSFDPTYGGGFDYEIDWENINFGDTSPSEPPSILNGGAFDVYMEFFELVSNDPNINAVLEDASQVYMGNMEFALVYSTSDMYAAIYTSIAQGYYDDFFNFFDEDDMNDFSFQYNWDEELGGYIKEYV